MVNVVIIAAVANNNGIGSKGKLPWQIRADLEYFKLQTLGSTVIMGRNTFQSIGKPLKGRTNFVLSMSKEELGSGVSKFDAFHTAVQAVKTPEAFVIGGADVYKQALDYASKMLITQVFLRPECDVFFPIFSYADWELEQLGSPQLEDGVQFRFNVWRRR